jgi:hypothetical protein
MTLGAHSGRYARLSLPEQVETGARFEARIRLQGLHGRAAKSVYRRYRLLTSSNGTSWEVVRRAAVTRQPTHDFTLTAPSDPGRYRLRLELLRPHGQRSLTAGTVSVKVRAPEPIDLGSADDWSSISGKNADGTPVRWDPCAPIRWTFNPNGTEAAYPQALEDITTSMSRISAYTGLRFEYVGAGAVIPYATTGGDMHPVDDTTPDLFVGFARRAEVPLFNQGVIGLGGPAYYRTAIDNAQWIDTAGVVLNTALLDSMRELDDEARNLWRSLITHEVLHAVGLGHSVGEQQVMYPYVRATDRFGAGDITGMQVHGATQGCAAGFPIRTSPVASRTSMSVAAPAPPVAHTRSDLMSDLMPAQP